MRFVFLSGRPLVAPREAHDALRPAKDRVSVQALSSARVARQPGHFAVHSSRNEGLVALDVSIETHVGARDSDGVEPERARLGAHLLSEASR